MLKRILILLMLWGVWPSAGFASEARSSLAENLFKQYSPGIYQVQTISTHAGKKNSLGSGFQISPDGYVVTNYHVVSSAVLFPSLYHIRIIRADGNEQAARIVNFDVVHDLAIIKVGQTQGVVLPLGSSEINKGRKIFAFGNPMDFGMTIVEGLSNGYMDKALYKKVLTSLALNPGMSGGPTLDESGNVVGVNVSTAGNAIGFVVPVEFLKELWREVQANEKPLALSSTDKVQRQLIDQEKSYFKKLLEGKWDKQKFGDFLVPTTITPEFTCWGEQQEHPESWLIVPYLECRLKDDIFVSNSIQTHQVIFNYSWLQSRGNDWWRFYTLADNQLSDGYRFDLRDVTESDVENFKCSASIVKIDRKPFWVSTCARQYKRMTSLYDINVRMASLGGAKTMLQVELTLGGVTKETVKSFMDKFYREIKWAK